MTPRTVHEVLEAAMEAIDWSPDCVQRLQVLKSTLPDLPILQEGMVAVPEEPTQEMAFAGGDAIRGNNGEGSQDELRGDAISAYRAMLSAAKEGK